MRGTLFRQEAVQYAAEPIKGELLLATSPRTFLLTLCASAIAVLTVAYLCLGEFNRKASVHGYLSPDKGMVKVFPQATGTLLESRVVEGSHVEKGQVLAVISTERGSLQVPDASGEAIRNLSERQQSLENEMSSQEQIHTLRRAAIEQQLVNLAQEARQLDGEIRTVQSRQQQAQEQSARFATLNKSGFVASTDVYRQQDMSLELRSQLHVLQREHIALQGRQQGLELERTSVDLEWKAQQESLKRRILELQHRRSDFESSRENVVTAPADGIVTTVLIHPGQQTRPDLPLLSIIPYGAQLQARLLVPSHAIGFVATGQEVAIRYDAFPYQRFGHYRGVVVSIAKTLLQPGDVDVPAPLSTPAYLVTVTLEDQAIRAYDRRFALQAGMSLDADVLLDRRSILQWMFDPLFSLTSRS